jgi:enoyl-CoA hydratase
MNDVVNIERTRDVATVTLNRPASRNALNAELAERLVAAISDCADAGAIVLTGSDPAFCAGLDLRNLGVERLYDMPQFLDAVSESPVPIIAAVNGPAVTGGFELALACDFIVASERARFADTHLRVGVYPGPVLVTLPRRIGMAKAREMTLTGNFVDADVALRIGLANHVVPHDQLLPFSTELAEAIAEQDRAMVREARKDWDLTGGLPIFEAQRLHTQHARDSGFTDARAADIASRRDDVIARARDHGAN